MDRYDVGVVELPRRLRFVLEALQLFAMKGCRKGEHFQRHPTAERKLFRFINDPHAASADFTQDAEVAQTSAQRRRSAERFVVHQRVGRGASHHLECRKYLAENRRKVWIALGILLDLRLLVMIQTFGEFIGHLSDDRFERTGSVILRTSVN